MDFEQWGNDALGAIQSTSDPILVEPDGIRADKRGRQPVTTAKTGRPSITARTTYRRGTP